MKIMNQLYKQNNANTSGPILEIPVDMSHINIDVLPDQGKWRGIAGNSASEGSHREK